MNRNSAKVMYKRFSSLVRNEDVQLSEIAYEVALFCVYWKNDIVYRVFRAAELASKKTPDWCQQSMTTKQRLWVAKKSRTVRKIRNIRY